MGQKHEVGGGGAAGGAGPGRLVVDMVPMLEQKRERVLFSSLAVRSAVIV